MKKRACFSFRPRLDDPEQRRAWQALQAVPEGRKTAFVARAILKGERQENWEETLRKVLREELQATGSNAAPVPCEQPAVPVQMLDFLAAL